MWKLFISIIAMSDTGAVSTNVAVSDYTSRNDCFMIAKELSGRTMQQVNEHKFSIVIRAQCSGDNMPAPQVGQLQIPRWPW